MAERFVVGSYGRWTEKITFSGGAAVAEYPLSNMKIVPPAKIWRTPNLLTASTQFVATLDKPRGVRLLALIRHNLSLDATIRIRVYAEAAMTTLLHDTGFVDVWPSVYTQDQLEWEDENWWTGKYTQDEIDGYNSWNRPFWLNQVYVAQAFKVEIVDTTNPAGYIEAGLFEIAFGWQASVNFAYGSERGFRFRTNSIEAEGGVKYFDKKDKPRVFQGTINYLPHEEAQAKAFEALRQMDLDKPFLFMPHPSDERHWLRDVFLARHVDPGLIAYASYSRDNVPLKYEEVL